MPTKFSELPAVSSPATGDEFAVNQAGTSKKVTLSQILGAGVSPGSFTSLLASSSFEVGGDAVAAGRAAVLNTAAGQARDFAIQTGGVDRWLLRGTSDPESGGDAGTDLQLLARDDSGAAIGTVLSVTRADLAAVFGGSLRAPILGVGAAPDASKGVVVGVTGLTGTTQIGADVAPVFGSGATAAAHALRAKVETPAAAFTVTEAVGLHIPDATKGSGSTITTLYGLKVDEPTQGATNLGASIGGKVLIGGELELDGDLNHDGSQYGLCGAAPSAPQSGYTTFANLTTVRTLDANSTTVDEIADVLGTLIVDLKAKNIIAG